MSDTGERGVLYIVSTPIGNLEDITLRALRILREVDLIAAEDTRVTRRLLVKYEIRTPCVSCFSRNEVSRIPMLLDRLRRGDSIAIVSDAGTPGISDPASFATRAAIDSGYTVIPVPGASAVLAALVTSGLSIDRFLFEGFLPIKKKRNARLRDIAQEEYTVVLYESVHRLTRTLRDLRSVVGNRNASVSREISKKFEETIRGDLDSLIAHFEQASLRGEFTVVLEGTRSLDARAADTDRATEDA